MKKMSMVAVLAMGLSMVACESTDSSGDFTCDVSRTSSSVSVRENVPGLGSYTSTVTAQVDDYGYDYVNIETEYWYANSSRARSGCDSWKEEESSWRDGSMKVTCSGNSVYISEYDEGSLASHERNFEEMCADDRAAYERGDI